MCCDYISGDLILCFPKIDLAAKRLVQRIINKELSHIKHEESLEGKLANLGLRLDDDFEFEYHRIKTTPGEELWKITYLQHLYKKELLDYLGSGLGHVTKQFIEGLDRYDYHFTVELNSVLHLASNADNPVPTSSFTFNSNHEKYKLIVNAPSTAPPNTNDIIITIIDSGITPVYTSNIDGKESRNFTDAEMQYDIRDNHGHGTLVALIIKDLAPNVRVRVYKVADSDGRISEWDSLAALSVSVNSNIVNISLQFGLKDRVCRICGRESQSSRKAAFENVVNYIATRDPKPIMIGAVGNLGQDELAFPARFSEVLAIGAINSRGELSSESNYGNQYAFPGNPDNHFVCPGGDPSFSPPETIGSFGPDDRGGWHGTSFASAYASGIVANLIARQGNNYNYPILISTLRTTAKENEFVPYDPKKYGHGLLRLPD